MLMAPRILLVVDRGSWTSQIENLVHLDKQRMGYVVAQRSKRL